MNNTVLVFKQVFGKRIGIAVWLGLLAIVGLGCGEGRAVKSAAGIMDPPPAQEWALGNADSLDADSLARGNYSPNEGPHRWELKPVTVAASGENSPLPTSIPRKVIYTAELHLVVEDFSKVEEELDALVKGQRGYIARMDSTGSAGDSRSGIWRVRIPVEEFDAFLEEVVQLGELQKRSRDSRDVTEEYHDLEARIKNKKLEEERLLMLLEKTAVTLEEILRVEKELSRVRGEIEQMQGRLNLLANQTTMTTVTIHVQERRGYVPPTAPTFTANIGRTFDGSLEKLLNVGKGLVLFGVAVTPWLPVAMVVGVGGIFGIRRLVPRRTAAIPPAEASGGSNV